MVNDSYAYDGNGVRTSTTPATGSATWYLYDPSTAVPQLLSTSTYNQSTSTWSAWNYVYGFGDAPIAQVNVTTSEVDLLSADAMGDVRAVEAMSGTNGGTLVNYTAYDSFGQPTNAGGLTGTTTGYPEPCDFGFGGGYTDETGLVYLVHRYFDPVTGQFLSVDPLNDRTGAGYSYAGDDPLDGTDPSGLLFMHGWGDGGCVTGTCHTLRWFQALNPSLCESDTHASSVCGPPMPPLQWGSP